jgi:undecaprenyl-diphosphatase
MARFTIEATSLDHAVRAWIMAHQDEPAHRFFDVVSTVGGVSPIQWVGILLAIWLWAGGRRRAALAVAASPLLAMMTYSGVRRVVARDRPPSAAGLREATSSFPSAHSTTATAVCCTVAYILWREKLLSTPAAIALGIFPPVIIGVSRLYLDVHWTTDVAAGWIGGLLIAALAAIVYRRGESIQRR